MDLHSPSRLLQVTMVAIVASLLLANAGWSQYAPPSWECRRCGRTLDSPICHVCQAEQTRELVASRKASQNSSYERGKAMSVLMVFGGFAGIVAFIVGMVIASNKKKSRRRAAGVSGHPRTLPSNFALPSQAESPPSPPATPVPPPTAPGAPPQRPPAAGAKPPAKAVPPKTRKPPIRRG